MSEPGERGGVRSSLRRIAAALELFVMRDDKIWLDGECVACGSRMIEEKRDLRRSSGDAIWLSVKCRSCGHVEERGS